MISSSFVLLLLGLGGPGLPPAPAVLPIRFEDLVRFSDVIAVGSVTRVETVDRGEWTAPDDPVLFRERLPARVPIAEVVVSQLLKGPAGTERVVYLACGTWTCDITSARVGERALFFLARAASDPLFDGRLLGGIESRFPGVLPMRVLWSGRGRMPLRALPEGEHASYWDGDVILPDDIPAREDPEHGRSFIRCAPLATLLERVHACREAQTAAWLAATVADPLDGSRAWDLELSGDRQARLVVHEATGDRAERFELDSRCAIDLWYSLLRFDSAADPETFGVRVPRGGTRTLRVLDPDRPCSLRILRLDADWMNGEEWERTELVLRAWGALRGSFAEPSCADHRPDDERWMRR